MSSPPSPKDWLILQCQACGSPMKIRAEALAGQRVACPACRSPIAVQPAGGDAHSSPEFKAVMPQDSDRLEGEALRKRLAEDQNDAEFAPSPIAARLTDTAPVPAVEDEAFLTGLRRTEDYQSESGRHVKVKKRRKKGVANQREVLMDWDTALEALPEAEIYSDPWTESVPIPEEVIKEKSRDFVVSEHDEDGNTVRRVKRVRKRRLFSLAQLFFRRLSVGMRILTLTVVAAIGLGGMAWGVIIFREHFKPVTYDDVVAEERPGQEHMTRQDESTAFDAVQAFLAAKGAAAKLPLVRLPKRVGPLMEKYYSRMEDRPVKALNVRGRDKIRTQGLFFVLLEVEVREPDNNLPGVRHFAVEETEDPGTRQRTYRVDWETAVEWREMPFDEFKTTRPRGNVPFRVKLSGASYYNHSFSDEKKWFSAKIFYPQPGRGNETIFFGYMDRNSQVFRQLGDMVESGQQPAVILNLRYPDNAVSPEQVVIDSMARNSWFYVEDVPPGQESKKR